MLQKLNKHQFRVAIIGKMLHSGRFGRLFCAATAQFHALGCPSFETPSDSIPWLVKLVSQDWEEKIPLDDIVHCFVKLPDAKY